MKTIQYMGSKKDLLDYLELSIEDFLKDIGEEESIESFFDAFCGSGRVAYHFRNKYRLLTNDKQEFTKTITDAYMCNTKPTSFYSKYIDELNNLPDNYIDKTDNRFHSSDEIEKMIQESKSKPSYFNEQKEKGNIDGWFTEKYACDWNDGVSVGLDGNPKVWRTINSRKIDMIRHKIEDFYLNDNEIGDVEKNVLLLSLILGVNKISNVVGHQNGYLKKWSQSALRSLHLEIPDIDDKHLFNHSNHTGDIFKALEEQKADIIYFDPPYGTNNKNLVVATRYSSFYHLWNTLVENDRPELFGKAGKPVGTKGYTAPLEKNIKHVVMPKLVRLIEESQSKYVAFSYSNKSLLTARDFKEVYRVAGCDMDTFRLYVSEHKSNNQNKLARKEGEYIDRSNDNDALIEYFFIAKKKNSDEHIRATKPYSQLTDDERKIEEKIQSISDWLANEIEDYSRPNEDYVREYIKEEKRILTLNEYQKYIDSKENI